MQSGQHVRQLLKEVINTLLKDLECLRKENFIVIGVVPVWDETRGVWM